MNRPALHDPFLAWEGELDGVRCRIVFTEFYDNPEEADPVLRIPIWMIHVERSDGDDALGKPVWLPISAAEHGTLANDAAVPCLALALVDALGKRPLWAKEQS